MNVKRVLKWRNELYCAMYIAHHDENVIQNLEKIERKYSRKCENKTV